MGSWRVFAPVVECAQCAAPESAAAAQSEFAWSEYWVVAFAPHVAVEGSTAVRRFEKKSGESRLEELFAYRYPGYFASPS